jgi:ATP/maltotriose-dependent transcriptional regulator MalT
MLEGLAGMKEQTAEAATHAALFALYSAQRGELERFELYKAQTERQMRGMRLERARYVLLYAELEAERVQAHWDRALELCDELQERAHESDLRHLILYATETRAAIAQATRDMDLRGTQWKAALRLRRKLGFKPSAWDEFRLRELSSA